MDNYNYPAGSDTPDAPWNQVDYPYCPECGCEEFVPTGEFTFKCALCGYEEDNEPDWENMVDYED